MPQQFDFPGGRPMPQFKLTPKTVYTVIGVLVGLWILSGIYKVAPDEQGVVLRFGKLYEVTESGLHYHWPTPIEQVDKPAVTYLYSEEVGFQSSGRGASARTRDFPRESLMLTGDLNIIDIDMVVQYRVSNVVDAMFSVDRLGVDLFGRGVRKGLVHDACEAVLRQVIGRHPLDEALTEGKELIQVEIRDKLQELFSERYKCGLTVTDVFLQKVLPPDEVGAAFKDVISAKEDKTRLENEARGYQNDLIPKAKGEAEKLLKGAEAYTVERVRRAQGDADRFRAVFAEYKKAPDVTETRLYLETMEKVLPRMQKYVVETDENGGLLNLLNLDQKEGKQ